MADFRAAGQLVHIITEQLVHACLEDMASFISMGVLEAPNNGAEPSPVLAIAHDGRGYCAADWDAEPGEGAPQLCRLLRDMCAELGVDACVLSRRSGHEGARVAAFSSTGFAACAWDERGERTSGPDGGGLQRPFGSEAEVAAALELIGGGGTLILVSDRAGCGPVVGALDFTTDPRDIGLPLPTSGYARLDLCRAAWRSSVRERLAILYDIALPCALSLRGERVAVRQKLDIGEEGHRASEEHLSWLRALHGRGGALAAAGGAAVDGSEEGVEEGEDSESDGAVEGGGGTPAAHAVDVNSEDDGSGPLPTAATAAAASDLAPQPLEAGGAAPQGELERLAEPPAKRLAVDRPSSVEPGLLEASPAEQMLR